MGYPGWGDSDWQLNRRGKCGGGGGGGGGGEKESQCPVHPPAGQIELQSIAAIGACPAPISLSLSFIILHYSSSFCFSMTRSDFYFLYFGCWGRLKMLRDAGEVENAPDWRRWEEMGGDGRRWEANGSSDDVNESVGEAG